MHKQRALVLSLFLCGAFALYAQKQYRGTTFNTIDATGSPLPYGGIIRVNPTSMSPMVMLAFEPQGLGVPNGGCGLMQASNGAIYFMTQLNDPP